MISFARTSSFITDRLNMPSTTLSNLRSSIKRYNISILKQGPNDTKPHRGVSRAHQATILDLADDAV